MSFILFRCDFPHSVLLEALSVTSNVSLGHGRKNWSLLVIVLLNVCYSFIISLSHNLCSCSRSSLAPLLSACIYPAAHSTQGRTCFSHSTVICQRLWQRLFLVQHPLFFINSLQESSVFAWWISIKYKLLGNGTARASLILTEQKNF